MEKVAAEAITNHMEKKGSLHQGQYGGRRKRGAVDAVARMVVEAEEAWKKKQLAGALLMDVKGAFPTTNVKALTDKMRHLEVQEDLVQWTESFMGCRSVTVEVNGEEGEAIEYVSGLPQGSPVLPILFNTLMSDLGKRVEEEVDVIGLSFLDDVAWVARGGTVDEVV